MTRPPAVAPSWGEDGNIVAALQPQTGLSQVPSGGGQAVPVTNLNLQVGENTHRWPHLLPGGKAALFNASISQGFFDEAEIAIVSLKDHRRKTVLEHGGMYPRYLSSGHLVYVTKGTLFAVLFDLDRLEVRGAATPLMEISSNPSLGTAQLDFSRNGTLAYRTGGTEVLRTMQWVDAAGKTVSLMSEPGIYQNLRLSPDGSLLAYVGSQSSDLWIYDLQRGSKSRLTNGQYAFNQVWSPDGGFLVFSFPGGMFWRRADGAGKPQPLMRGNAYQMPTSFTPDGARLAYSEQTPGAEAEIRTIRVESNSGQLHAADSQLILKTSSFLAFPAFSPDGRWLAYADAEAAGGMFWTQADGAGAPRQLTQRAISGP